MKYSLTHEWIAVDSQGIGAVGLSAHGREELGEIVYAELPKVGQRVRRNEEICVLESTKAAADVYTPVSGEIVAVNTLEGEGIKKINTSPENEGWLYRIRLDHPDELDHLLTKEEYLSELGLWEKK